MLTILLLACLTQWRKTPPAPAWARDLAFERVQVEWIAEHSRVADLEAVLPGGMARRIRLLGHVDYDVRELAGERLESMGPGASHALCWGQRVGDAEIAGNSTRLWKLLFRCEHCDGGGRCPSCLFARPTRFYCPEPCGVGRRCIRCNGAGNWLYEMSIYRSLDDRNLFPPRDDR